MINQKSNTIGIYAYRILSRAYFYLPFLLIYLIYSGYTYFMTEMIVVIYNVAVYFYFLTKPKWMRRLTPKNSLLGSELVKIIGLFLLLFPSHILLLILAQMLLGTGYALGAGKDTLIINQFPENKKTQSKSNSFMFISLLVSGIMGSYLFNISNNLPIYATIGAAIISCFVILFMFDTNAGVENEKNRDIQGGEAQSISFKRMNFIEKRSILDYSVLRALILSFFTAFLPIYLFFFIKVNIYEFIIILSSYTLMGFASSTFVAKLKVINIVWASIIPLFITYILLLSQNIVLIVIGIILMGIASGIIRPKVMAELGSQDIDLKQAISKMESVFSLLSIILIVFGAVILQFYGVLFVIVLYEFVLIVYILTRITLKIKR